MSENHFAMISDWMTNGNINEFVKEHPDVNRFKLVGFHFTAFIPNSFTDGMIAYLAGRRCRGFDLSS